MNIGESKKTLLQSLGSVAVLVLTFGGISPATAASVNEVEPNDSVATAQNIDANFTLDFDPNIGDSTSNTSTIIPHVTIIGTGDRTNDYYSFTVNKPGDKGIFDIDFGSGQASGNFDAFLNLFDSGGNPLGFDDDSNPSVGAGGSSSSNDSYLEFLFATPGVYVIRVGGYPGGLPVPAGATYQLQVSLENAGFSFESFTIDKAEIEFDDNPSKENFKVQGTFTLRSNSDGINPITEDVSMSVGTASVTIPAGSFVGGFPKFEYKGTIGDGDVKMVIKETTMNTYRFKTKVRGIDITNTANPLDIRLQVGNEGNIATNIKLEGSLKFKVKNGYEDDDKRKREDRDDD